jgi:multidrug efflux pump subunit AcrA (membrane-fusion protein)
MTQDDAAFVKDGDPAIVTVTQLPSQRFTGRVTRHPSALMTSTRTMLVEVDLPNDDLLLFPGMYAHVQVALSGNSTVPLVPDDALVFKDGNTFVPIVRDNRIHLAEVTLGFDDGIRSQITSGLTGNEMVILSLGQSAREGEVVQSRLEADAR